MEYFLLSAVMTTLLHFVSIMLLALLTCGKKNKPKKDPGAVTTPSGHFPRQQYMVVYNPAYNAQIDNRPRQNFGAPQEGQMAHIMDPNYLTFKEMHTDKVLGPRDREMQVKEMPKAAAFDPNYRTLKDLDDDDILGPLEQEKKAPLQTADPKDPAYVTLRDLDADVLLPHDDKSINTINKERAKKAGAAPGPARRTTPPAVGPGVNPKAPPTVAPPPVPSPQIKAAPAAIAPPVAVVPVPAQVKAAPSPAVIPVPAQAKAAPSPAAQASGFAPAKAPPVQASAFAPPKVAPGPSKNVIGERRGSKPNVQAKQSAHQKLVKGQQAAKERQFIVSQRLY